MGLSSLFQDSLSYDALMSFWTAPQVTANIVMGLHLIGALVLGLCIGYERSFHGRAAGMRTYGLVCVAACGLTVISGYSDLWFAGHWQGGSSDPTRVIQGIVTGIGFLGTGVIMRDGFTISGLTTAASIWGVATIGVLVGLGFYLGAIVLTILSFIMMMWGSKLESYLPQHHAIAITVMMTGDLAKAEGELRDILHRVGYRVAPGSFAISETGGQSKWQFVAISAGRGRSAPLLSLGRLLSAAEGVTDYQINHARN
ncbi:MAG: MgtC/SapB family protein [Alphaproteobacteria bacterium]|nr:MgtC/SapB family protein [Alphaproteobacteria bacterium]MBV8548459.1 MgtC/SapB family protein [Alphaproteobacteria bacterium]